MGKNKFHLVISETAWAALEAVFTLEAVTMEILV